MYKSLYTLCIAAVLLLSPASGGCSGASAQDLRPYERLLQQADMQRDLEYIASDEVEGRESGSPGRMMVERYIVGRFKALGLKPWNWSYTQSVPLSDSVVMRNVVGWIPAVRPSDEYIIIGAHYDHIGKLAGRIYNGADDNASGVTVMLSLAQLFSAMKADGAGPRKNLIFIAFDGKEHNLGGSTYFVRTLEIPRKQITCAVNMDMIGTHLVPPGVNDSYMFALGENTLKECYRGYLEYICRKPLYKMDLDLTFYGSRNFYQMMYETSDQHPFVRAGIPAVLFTSAFHEHTYRPTDDVDIIDFPLLRRRTLVIFNFVARLCRDE